MNTNDQTAGVKPIGLLFVTSGLIGFGLGAFVFGCSQDCVEVGQALAGVVKYPPEAPHGLILRHMWSLVNQLSALGLLAGLSEVSLSYLISGLVGMLSFQALALFTFAINGRLWISILAPMLIFYSHATYFGKMYAVVLMGFSMTNGMTGLAYVLLVVAAFGVGWNRAAAFCLGLAPACHLVLGGLMWIVVPLACVLGTQTPWKQNRALMSWFLAGASAALGSFWIQRMNLPPLPETNPADVKRHLLFFIQHWDCHRHPVVFSSPEILLNLLGLAVCFTYLKKHSTALPERLKLMFKTLVVAGTLALVFALLTHLPLSWLPLVFTRAMPARLLNVFVISYAAIILGLLTREGSEGPEQFFATVLILLLLAAVLLPGETRLTFVLWTLAGGGAILLLLLTKALAGFDLTRFSDRGTLYKKCQVLLLIGFTLFMPATIKTNFPWDSIRRAQAAYTRGEIAETGLLLTASTFTMAQFYARKPILLDVPVLDNLCYVPKLAPATAAILKDVYGIDFFNPPVESRRTGGLKPPGIERKLWESWSVEKWKTVREKYHVIDVLVPPDWKLQLPVKARAGTGLFYHIPAGKE